MSSIEFLMWVRGPAFQIAVVIFGLGVAYQLLDILILGRKPDYAESRGGVWFPGLRTVGARFFPDGGTLRREPMTILAGYVFHLGLFIVLVFFEPHIEIFHEWFGLRWPGLPTGAVDIVAGLTIVTLLIVLIYRVVDPVRRFLSQFEDYLIWTLTLLPVVSGYLVSHRLFLSYNTMLVLHLLSVEILLVIFPFTRLMHTFTLFLARWYNGQISGRRGVVS